MKINNKLILVVVLITATAGYSQDLDSLFTTFVNHFEARSESEIMITGEPTEVTKCGLPLIGQIRTNFDSFTKDQQSIVTSLLSRPVMTHSIISPSGHFKIHYNESGHESPTYSVDETAIAIDSVYEFMVNYLGYPPAPSDNGAGGDDKYDIYIRNLGNVYGSTVPESSITILTSTSYIQIDDNFSGYYTEGLPAAKITLAHEYHHAIQIGNYRINSNDQFYYEITSTSMEDFVFDYVDDYVGYMRNYFNAPYNSFSTTSGSGYDLAVWNIYLDQKFKEESDTTGFYIIKRSWEFMRSQRALAAISSSLEAAGSSFKNELNNFGIWTFFTNERTKVDKYFKDAHLYPLIKSFNSINYIYTPPEYNSTIGVEPMTNNFLIFEDNSQNLADILVSIVTNADILKGITNPSASIELSYALHSNSSDGANEIIPDRYYSLITSNNNFFTESNIFNNELASQVPSTITEIEFAYPQPYKYSNGGEIRIPTKANILNEVELSVFTTSMEQVFNSKKTILTGSGNIVIHWDGTDNSGNKLPTGIYIFVTDSEGEITKGKIAIIND